MRAFLQSFLTFVALGVTLAGALLASDQLWLLCLGVVFLCLLYVIWSFIPRLEPGLRAALAGQGPPAAREQAQQASLSRSVQLLAGFLLAGFLALGAQLLREQVVQAGAIAHSRVINVTTQTGPDTYTQDTTLVRNGNPITFTRTIRGTDVQTGTDSLQNPRLLAQEQRIQRGRIFDASGRPIADRVVYSDTGYVARTYPVPDMSYLLGYYNPRIYGLAGLESRYDDYLGGGSGSNPLLEAENSALHRAQVGDDLYLTLVPAIQDAATAALGERKGAVVVLDVQTGAVLALVTYPHFDPNGLSFDPNAADYDAETKRIVDYWTSVTNEQTRPDLPMLNRATQGLYPPGSTFKTVTLSAGIDQGKVRPDTLFTDTGRVKVEAGGYFHVDCSTCRPAGHPGNIFTLQQGYQWSLNVIFAELAVNYLGADSLTQYAQRFGYGQTFDLGVPVEASRLGDPDFVHTPNGLAATSYGQGQMQATPLQMALIAATIGRDGQVPRPYLVARIVSPSGSVVQQAQPGTLNRVVSPDSETILRQMMITSVQKGWANGVTIPGAVQGGKTGTAETGRGTLHAWYIGFAGRDAAHIQYAVAAMVEEGGEGSRVAVPIARATLLAALGQGR